MMRALQRDLTKLAAQVKEQGDTATKTAAETAAQMTKYADTAANTAAEFAARMAKHTDTVTKTAADSAAQMKKLTDTAADLAAFRSMFLAGLEEVKETDTTGHRPALEGPGGVNQRLQQLEESMCSPAQTMVVESDRVARKHLLSKARDKFFEIYRHDPDFEPMPADIRKHIPSQAYAAFDNHQLEFLNLDALDVVFEDEHDTFGGQGNSDLFDAPTQEAQRDYVLRLAGLPLYFHMRLLYRYVYRTSVGTAAAALLSYTAAERLVACLKLSEDAAAAEAAAVIAEEEIMRIHPEWRV